MKTVVSSHNWQLLKPLLNTYACNFMDRNNCLLDNKCKTPQVVYLGVSNNLDNEIKYYCGLTETSFKEKYGNRNSLLFRERSRNLTKLSGKENNPK